MLYSKSKRVCKYIFDINYGLVLAFGIFFLIAYYILQSYVDKTFYILKGCSEKGRYMKEKYLLKIAVLE